MPRQTGTKKTGGRQKGTPNKATSESRNLAQQHGAAIIERLAHLALNAMQEKDQIAACKEVLNRAYGKSAQYIEADMTVNMGLVERIQQGRKRIAGKRES